MDLGAESASEASIEVTVIRGNSGIYGPPGSVEHRGTVSYWHKNPLRRLLWKVKQWRLSK